MLFAVVSWLLTIVCLIVRGLNSILNEVNEKVKWRPVPHARSWTCDSDFHSPSFPYSPRKLSPIIVHSRLLETICLCANLLLLLWIPLYCVPKEASPSHHHSTCHGTRAPYNISAHRPQTVIHKCPCKPVFTVELAEAYLEPRQTSEIERFAEIIDVLQPLNRN